MFGLRLSHLAVIGAFTLLVCGATNVTADTPQQAQMFNPGNLIHLKHPGEYDNHDHIHKGALKINAETKGHHLYLFRFPNDQIAPIQQSSVSDKGEVLDYHESSQANNHVYVTNWDYDLGELVKATHIPLDDSSLTGENIRSSNLRLAVNQVLYVIAASNGPINPHDDFAQLANNWKKKQPADADHLFILVTQKLDNGITVGQAKLFDDRTLSMILDGLQKSLAQTTFPNPTSLYSLLGQFQGATATQSAQAFTATGLPTPQVVTTLGQSTNASQNNQNSVQGTANTSSGFNNQVTTGTPAGSANSGPGTTTSTTTSASNGVTINTTTSTSLGTNTSSNQTITQPGVTPTPPSLPSQIAPFAFQPTFGLNAQDLLSDQVSLTYQILNLRMLLDRSLTDRLYTTKTDSQDPNKGHFQDRLQAVLGFQISVDALRRYPNAVAEVDLTVETDDRDDKPSSTVNPPDKSDTQASPTTGTNTGKEGPQPKPVQSVSLVALFPQNKTYNVAKLSQKVSNIGFGAVVDVVNIGVASGRASQRLYLIRDTDTVALEREPMDEGYAANPNSVRFAWQFRPVLGRSAVEPGTRQVFALLSLPKTTAQEWTARIRAVTHWRRYNPGNGSVGDIIKGSESSQELLGITVPRTDDIDKSLTPEIDKVRWQDIGQGMIQVVVVGKHFLPGTSVVIGGSPAVPANLAIDGDTQMRFTIPALQVALAGPPIMVGRYGSSWTQQKIEQSSPQQDTDSTQQKIEQSSPQYDGLEIQDACFRLIDPDNAEVHVKVHYKPKSTPSDQQKSNPVPPAPVTVPLHAPLPLDAPQHRPVAVIGDQIFGVGSAPILYKKPDNSPDSPEVELVFIVPTKLIRTARIVRVTDLFWTWPSSFTDSASGFTDSHSVENVEDFSATNADIVSSKSHPGVRVLIRGSGFHEPRVYIGTRLFIPPLGNEKEQKDDDKQAVALEQPNAQKQARDQEQAKSQTQQRTRQSTSSHRRSGAQAQARDRQRPKAPKQPGAQNPPKVQVVDHSYYDDHLITIVTDASWLDGVKKIIVSQEDALPVVLTLDQPQESAVPTVIAVDSDPAYKDQVANLPQSKGKNTIVGKNYHVSLKLQGANLDSIKEVHYDDSKPALKIKADKDPTILYLDPSDFDGTPGTYNLHFLLKDGTTHGGAADTNILTVYVREPPSSK